MQFPKALYLFCIDIVRECERNIGLIIQKKTYENVGVELTLILLLRVLFSQKIHGYKYGVFYTLDVIKCVYFFIK